MCASRCVPQRSEPMCTSRCLVQCLVLIRINPVLPFAGIGLFVRGLYSIEVIINNIYVYETTFCIWISLPQIYGIAFSYIQFLSLAFDRCIAIVNPIRYVKSRTTVSSGSPLHFSKNNGTVRRTPCGVKTGTKIRWDGKRSVPFLVPCGDILRLGAIVLQ